MKLELALVFPVGFNEIWIPSVNMKITLLFLIGVCWLTICSAQTIYISSNLPGKHRFVVDHVNDRAMMMIPGKYVEVKCGKLLEVWYSDSNHVTQYEFGKKRFKNNDTLNLIFTFYHSTDTTFYTSGCLDGSYPVNKTSTKEFNIGTIEIDSLPDQIRIMNHRKIIVLQKTEPRFFIITRGNGNKEGKDWGFSESTRTRHIIYRN
jgi:hypothetical protein